MSFEDEVKISDAWIHNCIYINNSLLKQIILVYKNVLDDSMNKLGFIKSMLCKLFYFKICTSTPESNIITPTLHFLFNLIANFLCSKFGPINVTTPAVFTQTPITSLLLTEILH